MMMSRIDLEEDKLVWDDDMHGNYSVKSGYNLLLKPKVESVVTVENADWNLLWKIHAPPKAKHLLWRICKGCLPTRTRLNERCVQVPLVCPICENDEESDWHFLFECENSKQAWQAAGIDLFTPSYLLRFNSITTCILDFCRSNDKNVVGKAAMTVWVLWNNRNNWVFNHTKEQGQHLGGKATSMWSDWKFVQAVNSSSSAHEQNQLVMQWQKPNVRWYKCNVDASFHHDARKTSVGWCVWDSRGYFVLGGSYVIQGRCSINEGEAIAMLEAIKELSQRGFTNVLFETDSKNVADAIRHMHNGVSEFSSIIHKIKCMLSFNSDFEVKSVRRQANMVAHTIARAAISWPSRYVFDLIPPCINNLLYNEMI
ncbi:hypothetical protein TSUD_237000 [Trifolium subterraneum]|uniref:RNase H type-1 domain-containing protein n=1 Tax=Trifolium subterraneum TaxID=3900 RepID=A0A2Z6P3B1_TRISU|nr:hypothetical protein TSUD_237000 [Trifolium subterraneum]